MTIEGDFFWWRTEILKIKFKPWVDIKNNNNLKSESIDSESVTTIIYFNFCCWTFSFLILRSFSSFSGFRCLWISFHFFSFCTFTCLKAMILVIIRKASRTILLPFILMLLSENFNSHFLYLSGQKDKRYNWVDVEEELTERVQIKETKLNKT